MVCKREDGPWEGRIVVSRREDGGSVFSIFHYIYPITQKELSAKLRQNIDVCYVELPRVAHKTMHTTVNVRDTYSTSVPCTGQVGG